MKEVNCPNCGKRVYVYQNPFPTVDLIIERQGEVLLIKRLKEPKMWALPGGFCEYGESLEEAALREAKEETGLVVELVEQFYTYSEPWRDPRQHNITTVFIARPKGGNLKAGDDAEEARFFPLEELPPELAFDHKRILEDFIRWKETGRRPKPIPPRPA